MLKVSYKIDKQCSRVLKKMLQSISLRQMIVQTTEEDVLD